MPVSHFPLAKAEFCSFYQTNLFLPTALNLSGGDGLAETGTALSGAEVLTLGNGLGLLDNLLTLGQDELDVAGVGHVGVDL